jgi:hypothetical protein
VADAADSLKADGVAHLHGVHPRRLEIPSDGDAGSGSRSVRDASVSGRRSAAAQCVPVILPRALPLRLGASIAGVDAACGAFVFQVARTRWCGKGAVPALPAVTSVKNAQMEYQSPALPKDEKVPKGSCYISTAGRFRTVIDL